MSRTPNGMAPLVDDSHFPSIYAEHATFVWRAVIRLGVASEYADDVVQEVFLVVHRRLAEFRRESSIRTWLYAIAVRVSRNHRRTAARRRRIGAAEPLDDDALASCAVVAEGCGPDALFEARAIAAELLDELAEEQREVFVLAELEGLSVPEIADIVTATTNTVYSRLRLGRRTFEMALKRRSARDAWKTRARVAAATSIARLAKAASGAAPLVAKVLAAMVASATIVPPIPAAPETPRHAVLARSDARAMPSRSGQPRPLVSAPSVASSAPVVAVRAPAANAPPPVAVARDRLADDVRYLRDAQSLLVRDDPTGALRASDAVRAEGPLAEEREAVRLMSRCALADPLAREAARDFARRWPGSAVLPRIATTCRFDDGGPARGH